MCTNDTPDHNGQGCFQPVLVVVLVCLLVCCAATKPSFKGTITAPDGKVSTIAGTYDPGKSWAERNLGPFGALISALAAVVQAFSFVPVP